MRKFTMLSAFFFSLLIIGSSALQAQTKISDWGAIGTRLAGSGWTLDIDGTTPAGDAYLSGPGTTNSTWTAIRGGFDSAIDLTVGQTLVVSGTMEINGIFEGWGPLRLGVYNHTDIGSLVNAGTDSAKWGYIQYAGTDSAAFVSNESGAHGYLITNQTGANGGISGQGGNGSLWSVNGGSWISTWSGGQMTLGQTVQSPRRAIMPAGTYDIKMSIELTSDSTSTIKWYIMNQDGESYLHSGEHVETFNYVGTDSSNAKTSFNGFAFSHEGNDGNDSVTEVNLTGFEYGLGEPITIPDPIFSSFYVDQWGAIGTRLAGSGWTLDNDTTTLVGDAYLSGPGTTNSTWTAIRGGFGELPVKATLEEAVIVRGLFEINEVFEGWGPIRMGVYNHTDIGTLHNQYTDSAKWGYMQYEGTDSAAFNSNEASAYGYLITNQTGANGGISGQGGNGSAWAVNGGSWISTWSGGQMTLGQTFQSPRRAIMPAGEYEFELSVQPLADGTTEFRWYILHEDGESYLQSGVHIDTTAQKTEFNGFVFSHEGNDGNELVTEVNLYEVEVDRGAPIEIPEPIFSSFYVDQWGAIGTRLAGSGWTLDNDTTTLVGDAYLSGPGTTSSNWSAIRGGFGDLPVKATLEEALIVRGIIEIDGSLEGWGPIRMGVYNHTDIGTLHNQFTDSAAWGYMQYEGTDSAAFNSNESSAYGYLITNQTGANGGISGQGGNGSAWAVNGGSWISTWSGGSVTLGQTSQSPRRAVMPAGEYEFEMSVQPLADGTTEFRWYILNDEDEAYLQSGIHIDTTAQKTEFNGFAFSHQEGDDATVTEINLYEVEVDRGEPIEIPLPFFSPFYVDAWGFLGDKFGGASATDSAWSLTPGVLVGDVEISGEAATGWANVAGYFGDPVFPSAEEAILVSGDVILDGGGFDEAGSLRIGLFNLSNPGSLDSTETVGYVWTGDDTGTGYLFAPSAATGSISSVENGAWYTGTTGISDIVGSGTAGEDTYELTLAVNPTADGKTELRLKLEGDDGYIYEAFVTDDAALVTEGFNAIVFGVNNSTTTGLVLEAIEVDKISPSEVEVNIESGTNGDLPSEFALNQNYPNPFNPSTSIKFDLPVNADVQLSVYNMLGQKVMTLVNGKMEAGFHQVTFNAGSLASGMYIYRLDAGSFVSTKKMMLIK